MTIKNIARWAVIAPLFLLPFLALYVETSLYFPFITGKNFAFRILMEIALGGYVVLAFADKRYRPRSSLVLASFGLLVLWMILADSLALNAHKAFWSNFERMDGFVTLAHLFALFVAAGSVLTVDRLWRKWWMAFLSAATLVSGYGLLQMAGLAQIHQSDTRLDATLGNSEYFAGFLLLAIAIAVWQAMESRQMWLRISLFVLVALQVVLLFATGTRGTFVALIIAAVIGGLLWLSMLGKRGMKGALVFLAVVVVFTGGFFAMRNTAFVQESPNLSRFASISISSLDVRFKIWGMALSGIKERPVTGWGHEGYNYVFNKYYDPSLYGQESWFDRAHNIYLDWAIAGGIPALLLFLLLGGSAVYAVYRARELEPWERVLIISAIIGYAIQGLAVFDNLFTYIPIVMLLTYAHTLRSRPIKAFESRGDLEGAKLDTILAPVALIVVLVLVYMVNIPTYAAGKELIQGLTPRGSAEARFANFQSALGRDPFATQEIREQLLSFGQAVVESDASKETKNTVVTFAADEIEKEIARAPQDARLYALYASFLRGIGAFDEARSVAAKARELSPTKEAIMVDQGVIEWQAGDLEKARTYFDEAYALSTTSDELVVYAAGGRILTNDVAGGKELLNERFGTTTVNHIMLVYAYQEIKDWPDLIATMQKRYSEMHDATTGYQFATAYAAAGRFAEARTQARAVMTEFPESASQGTEFLLRLGSR